MLVVFRWSCFDRFKPIPIILREKAEKFDSEAREKIWKHCMHTTFNLNIEFSIGFQWKPQIAWIFECFRTFIKWKWTTLNRCDEQSHSKNTFNFIDAFFYFLASIILLSSQLQVPSTRCFIGDTFCLYCSFDLPWFYFHRAHMYGRLTK